MKGSIWAAIRVTSVVLMFVVAGMVPDSASAQVRSILKDDGSGGYDNTDSIVEDGYGRVGIGTTNPITDFDVNVTTSLFNYLRLTHASGRNYLQSGASRTTGSWAPLFIGPYNSSTDIKMVIDSSGRVGIGTTIPAYSLEVTGNSKFGSDLTIDGDLYVVGSPLFVDRSGLRVGMGTNTPSANSKLHVIGNYAGGVAAIFNNDGNHENRYGIAIAAGEDTPDDVGQETTWILLHDGDGSQRGGIALFDGDPDIYTTSDPRVKTDIAPTKISGLAVIEALDLIEYRRINDKGFASKHLVPIGFNAENVAAEFPPAAGHLTESDIKTVAPGKLIPVLAKAVQELDAEVQDARIENARLVNELWELKVLVCLDHPTAAACK